MCVLNDGQHVVNQFVGGFLFGLLVGVCDQLGFFGIARIICVFLLIVTLLDHCGSFNKCFYNVCAHSSSFLQQLGLVMVPWGYHGPGYGPGRFNGVILTMEQFLLEIIGFLVNNCIFYISFVFWAAIFSGRIIVLSTHV